MYEELILCRRGRLPLPDGPRGDGAAATRQLDVALVSIGYKLADDLVADLSRLQVNVVMDLGRRVVDEVRSMVGDHVEHNVYFRDFPANVPDTHSFWTGCIRHALADPTNGPAAVRLRSGSVNLLDLPLYGRYQHSYDDMAASRERLAPAGRGRLRVITRGGPVEEEVRQLYVDLATSGSPLSPNDLATLRELAVACVSTPLPSGIPVRENKAMVNRARLLGGLDLLVDTVTDVLRLACALSVGDVGLGEATRFTSLRRRERRALLAALDLVVAADPARLADVAQHQEAWKRLGERLHPHEYAERLPHSARVFAVARGEQRVPSLSARIEAAFAVGDLAETVAVLRIAPGLLLRTVDRLARSARTEAERAMVVDAVGQAVERASLRTVLSVREHLENRIDVTGRRRVFVNREARAWGAPDRRDPLPASLVGELIALADEALTRRLPRLDHLVVGRDVLDVALPLSAKTMPGGVGLRPRGSVDEIDGTSLRFFVHWRQHERTTDFDLSALLLDENYENSTWLSWTELTGHGGVHSGDIVDAPDGASEFIDLDLTQVTQGVIIPQVNVYSGEGFNDVAESFFGFMLRAPEDRGLPFEPSTVRMKSDLRGASRVALPLAFRRGDDGRWRAHWLHLFLRGSPAFNTVEGNRVTASELAQGIVERRHLTVRYLLERLRPADLQIVEPGERPAAGIGTYLGSDDLSALPRLLSG